MNGEKHLRLISVKGKYMNIMCYVNFLFSTVLITLPIMLTHIIRYKTYVHSFTGTMNGTAAFALFYDVKLGEMLASRSESDTKNVLWFDLGLNWPCYLLFPLFLYFIWQSVSESVYAWEDVSNPWICAELYTRKNTFHCNGLVTCLRF